MATFYTYKCDKCGYETLTDDSGFGAVMKGLLVSFLCEDCKEIVQVLMKDRLYSVNCPQCRGRVSRTWNPIDGKCPKCEGKMLKVPNSMLLAD